MGVRMTAASAAQQVTQLLVGWSSGDTAALDKLIPLVQPELHRLAHYCCCPLVFDRQDFCSHGFEIGITLRRTHASPCKQNGRDELRNRRNLSRIEHSHIATPLLTR